MARIIIPDDRILIMDGAMGTMIQEYSPFTDGNNDRLNLDSPDVIARIHREYIEAGADIIETNTFSSNRISQNEYGLSGKAREMAYRGASIARKVADEYLSSGRTVYVAGSAGPTSKSLSLSADERNPSARQYGFDEIAEAYREQIEALIEGGADFIMLETCFDALNTKAALYALAGLFPDRSFPVSVSVSVSDKSGRTLTGQTLEAFYTAVKHYPLLSFGLNCSLGASGLAPLMEEVAEFSECAVSCYPNAGLPNGLGGYDETPEKMAADMRRMAEEGLLDIAGGCCGTTPEHIRAVSQALKGIKPRHRNEKGGKRLLKVSGLETVTIDAENSRLTNIGERTNVAGSRKFARLVSEKKYEEALGVAADQIEGGAGIIDVSLDDAMLDSKHEMTVFTRYISNDPNVAKAALMIDSSHEDTLLAGLKNAQGKSIVNSISLKDGEAEFIRKAREINALGAALVVMAFDEKGQATDFARKIEVCGRAYGLLTRKASIPPEDIIFDANVLTVATGIDEHSRYAIDFIDAVRWIKENLPGALTSGGISNLSFAFRGNNKVREAMHSVFLYHAAKAGLDMAIVNPSMLEVYDDIEPELRRRIEDVIFARRKDATDRLIETASRIAEETAASKTGVSADSADTGNGSHDSPEDRLIKSLVKGTGNGLESDLMAVMNEKGSAVKVIEETLMRGMETVGEYFGQGKMFLPQVMKSARVMKEAVDILQPFMKESDSGRISAGKPSVVIATVKGDVHDIGKNITALVLKCNGFNVTDLGVMVEKEKILDTVQETNADIAAVSGLITPSLHQMEEICREMSARKMTTPLFIGGATTSALHTAIKLAPLYSYVFYGADASASAVMAKRYMSDREKFIEEEHRKQENLRKLYENRDTRHEPAPAPSFPAGSFLRTDEPGPVSFPATEIRVKDVMEFFDWNLFFTICRIKDTGSDAARQLKEEACEKISEMENSEGLRITAALEFFRAYSDKDTVCLEKDGDSFSIPMLRQENATVLKDGRKASLSLADFVPGKDSGMESPCGLFAVSADTGGKQELVGQAILDTLAEAAASMLENMISQAVTRPGMKIIRPAAGYSCFPDHSAKADILAHIKGSEKLGISLSESYGMTPDASVCGMVFIHQEACYPDIREIGPDQFRDYCSRRGIPESEGKILLGHIVRGRQHQGPEPDQSSVKTVLK